MKQMKRLLPLILALLLLLTVLVSCSGGGDLAENPMAPDIGYTTDAGAGGGVIDDRKIIREYDISLETKEFNKTVSDLRAAVVAVGGYEESARVTPPTAKRTGYADIVFRIPTEKLDTFNASIAGIGSVTSQNITSRDVTLSYADIEGRITALEMEEERLLELLSKANGISDTMNIQSRLTSVQSELKSYRNQLTSMTGRITMTSYTFSIQDVEEYTEETGFFKRLWSTITDTFSGFGSFLQWCLFALIRTFPYIFFFGIVITGIVHLCRIPGFRRRRAAKRAGRLHVQDEATDYGAPTEPPANTPPAGTPPPAPPLYGVDPKN